MRAEANAGRFRLDSLVRNRNRLFWTLNIAGWSGYVLAAWLGALTHGKPDAYVAVVIAAAAIGFLLSIPMRLIYSRLWSRPLLRRAAIMITVCYLLALGWRTLINTLYFEWVEDAWQPERWTDYIGGVLGSFYVLLCWSGLYFGIKYYQELQEQTERTLKATAMAHQAQLKMLRYQLNPHFLFNTLNAISTLILDGANRTANVAVSRLSDFLRYTLDNDPMKRVTLDAELGALDLYLEIEKVRFGDRLVVIKDIEPAARSGLVPSLILQPLIENAIKYAISPSEEGGTLRISAKVHGDMLFLQVADNGPGLGSGLGQSNRTRSPSSGVGLSNTRARLQQFYGDRQAFALAPNEPSGLVITMNIPFETDDDDPGADR